jgi:DNA (cytosine-5)-methyltransferase 1
MSYIENLNDLLRPQLPTKPRVLDLFSGCGGLALGFEALGFETLGFELDNDCCQTYRLNLRGQCEQIELNKTQDFPQADIIIGGPPCQPFSVIGEQKGLEDARDGFPIFLHAVQTIKPKIFLIENVRGLLFRNKSYFDLIRRAFTALGYTVEYQLINAAHYGVPQNRERVFIIGHQGQFQFPAQQQRKVMAGEALGQLASLIPHDAKFLTASMDDYVARYEKASNCITPRDLHLDKPARTLTCRNLAGATGDMMRVKLPDGRRRRLSVREAARLQTFPDWFEFMGSETSQFNQLGNAVPPLLAYQFAKSIAEYLSLEVDINKGFLQQTKPQQLLLPLESER